MIKSVLNAWDDILVYLVTLGGVLLTQFLPAFKSGQVVNLGLHLGNVVIAGFIALMFVLQDENSNAGVSPEVARSGKKKNLRRRLSHGIAQGISWATIIS